MTEEVPKFIGKEIPRKTLWKWHQVVNAAIEYQKFILTMYQSKKLK